MINKHWEIWIDTGGTFTDCFARDPQGNEKTLKVLSNSRLRCSISCVSHNAWHADHNWPIFNNILSGYEAHNLGTGESLIIRDFDPHRSELSFEPPLIGKKDKKFELEIISDEEVPVFAARILTHTPRNENLPAIEMRLGSTRGTNALLERKGAPTAFLVTKGFKDLIRIGTQQREDLFSLQVFKPEPYYDKVFEVDERLDANGALIKSIDQEEIQIIAKRLKDTGIDSVAIAFLHSYKNPQNENTVAEILSDHGFKHISLSSDLFNAIKILPRAETAVANAYLSPIITNYIENIENSIYSGHEGDLKVMTSAGGLIGSNKFKPKDSLLSGPAGGLVGASVSALRSGINKILTLDMGGTSTDVARYDNGFEYRYETKVSHARILSPALFIETIAAGGGSICNFDGFRFTVGPESAGAHPGPACYGAGGPLTITDVNLLLGKIDPENFGIPVHIEASIQALEALKRETAGRIGKVHSDEEILKGFELIANEKMAEAIRKISVSKGYDPKEYTLLAFGGAGGQHACQVAEILGMRNVLIPENAGLLSAFGIGEAYIERIAEKQILKPLKNSSEYLESLQHELESKVLDELKTEGFQEEDIYIRERFYHIRFKGQENTLQIQDKDRLFEDFKEQYINLYGHWIDDLEVELESIKIVGCNRKFIKNIDHPAGKDYNPEYQSKIKNWTGTGGNWTEIPTFKHSDLKPGANIIGPAIIGSTSSTTLIPSGWNCSMDQWNNCLISKLADTHPTEDLYGKPQEAELELFSNRFTAIAEEMGAMFQRTAFSVNIKERLDFSCAILDANGFLVVNAPHIPVHLGSLGICVRKLRESIAIEEGDVIITNHPGFGGSHLPDITLVSPVYHDGTLAGYVANRGHHAEVGGLLPGSTPPEAKSLEEEGVVIEPAYLVKKGKANWQTIRKIFLEALYPTRSIDENIADLNGALASIRLGIEQMTKMIRRYGIDTIGSYMLRIREHAHQALLTSLEPFENSVLKAREYLDNGACLQVKITIKNKRVTFDFQGTSAEQKNSFNATPAITTSAILYVLRLIANRDIPLNEGLLNSVDIILPHCLLNPDFNLPKSECPPVVGGNTETSQRVVDTLIKAFELSGCSQGTMNNLLFGNESFGYYETICGGTGAGNGFDGMDAVHQHMTNTRITDPEIMEFRYPVFVDEFSIRNGSGGKGTWTGGSGVSRKLRFKDPVELTIMSQHRKQEPYGMLGGKPGKKGQQWILTSDGKNIKLNGCASYQIKSNDSVIIQTPGGGGYGIKR